MIQVGVKDPHLRLHILRAMLRAFRDWKNPGSWDNTPRKRQEAKERYLKWKKVMQTGHMRESF